MTAYTDGYEAYSRHQMCSFLNGYAPANRIAGRTAIRLWHEPEDQGAALVQIARPHDAWRVEWVRGWDDARAEAAEQ